MKKIIQIFLVILFTIMSESTLSAFDDKLSNLCIVIEKNNIDKLMLECSDYVSLLQPLEIIEKKFNTAEDSRKGREIYRVYAREFRKIDTSEKSMRSDINKHINQYIANNYKSNDKQTLHNVDIIFSNSNYLVPDYVMNDILSSNGGNLDLSPNGLEKIKVYVAKQEEEFQVKKAIQKKERLAKKKAIQKKERLAKLNQREAQRSAKKKQIKEMKKAKVQNQNQAIAQNSGGFQNASESGWEMKQYQADCRDGKINGCYLIADSYMEGSNGFSKDINMGVSLYSHACDNGHSLACFMGGQLSVISAVKRRDFHEQYCNLTGRCSLWKMSYFNGCENRNSNDCYVYAQITEKGIGGGSSDRAGSLEFYDYACSTGIQDSCIRADELRQRGWERNKKRRNRLSWNKLPSTGNTKFRRNNLNKPYSGWKMQ